MVPDEDEYGEFLSDAVSEMAVGWSAVGGLELDNDDTTDLFDLIDDFFDGKRHLEDAS